MYPKHCTSIHEVSHALVQAVLQIGPQKIWLSETGDGWIGQTLAFDDAPGGEKLARLLITQLAGPIGQIVVAPDSLGEFKEMFKDRFLEPSILLYRNVDRPLHRLGWESDLTAGKLILKAESAQKVWNTPVGTNILYEMGSFLFYAQDALFEGFRYEQIRREVVRLASILEQRIVWSGPDFYLAAVDAIASTAWTSLKAQNFKFRMDVDKKK